MHLTHDGEALNLEPFDEGGTVVAEFESSDKWSCHNCGGDFTEESEAEDEECSEADCSSTHDFCGGVETDGPCVFVHGLEHHKAPLSWVNAAHIDVREDDDLIEVGISVGDPRGAFVMRMWRTPEGKIMMNLPYPGEPQPHAPLKCINDGSYIVNESD